MSPPLKENFEIKDNICEICGRQASAGILDDEHYVQTRIRYTCQDHYITLHDKIVNERVADTLRNRRRRRRSSETTATTTKTKTTAADQHDNEK